MKIQEEEGNLMETKTTPLFKNTPLFNDGMDATFFDGMID